MARDAIAFLTALDVGQIDLLGFSIGSFVAQEIALRRPALVSGDAPHSRRRFDGALRGAGGQQTDKHPTQGCFPA